MKKHVIIRAAGRILWMMKIFRFSILVFLHLAISALFFLPLASLASARMAQPVSGNQPAGKYFQDVPSNHPFASSVDTLKAKKFVAGYSDKTFKPENSIARSEFITMVMASISAKPQGKNCFSDVRDQWFAPFVCAAKTQGLISGYPDKKFRPNNNISFAEAAAVIAKAHKLSPSQPKTGEPWYKPAITKLSSKKAIPVTIDAAGEKLSRAETAEIIYRLKLGITTKPSKTYKALSSSYPQIASCPELKEMFSVFQYRRNRPFLLRGEFALKQSLPMSIAADAMPAPAVGESEGLGGGGEESSSTNVQVEGVDEADIIKNDNEYIYIISDRTIRIVKAYPPANMEVSSLTLDDENFYPSEMFLAGQKLVVIGSTYNERSRVKVYVFDVSDKSNMKRDRELAFDGYEISSRRIGNRLYLVLNYSPDFYRILEKDVPTEEVLPKYFDSKRGIDRLIAPCSGIRYIPQNNSMNMVVVTSFDVSNSSSEVSKETILGGGENVYASLGSLYVAGSRYEYPDVGIMDLWFPPPGREKTVFYRFSLDDGVVQYKTQGEVKGSLLNQFSMDEEGNAFRVAVTTGEVWNSKNPSKNHLYILNRENLGEVFGKIENIAPGERIYSVRFLGKRMYMVTFKKIDPFFVIDVEDPRNPKILGALKIPGYSDYLHPFDENHIIGFGKEAVDPQEIKNAGIGGRDFDFAWYQGMKIALFDVTDVANPKVLHKELIGDRGTDSELLRNHKALLYDKKRNIFAFPIQVAEVKNKTGYTGSEYGTIAFQGAYIYRLDLENGFKLLGKVTHHSAETIAKNAELTWWPEDKNTIKRVLYIGDYFFTVSSGKVKALKREDISEVKEVEWEVKDGGSTEID